MVIKFNPFVPSVKNSGSKVPGNESAKKNQIFTQKSEDGTETAVKTTPAVIKGFWAQRISSVKNDAKKKIKETELKRKLIKSGALSDDDLSQTDERIGKLANLDCNAVLKKAQLMANELERAGSKRCLDNMYETLADERLSVFGLKELIQINEARAPRDKFDINSLMKQAKLYDNFDFLPASKQNGLIRDIYFHLSYADIKKAGTSSSLLNIPYIAAIRDAGSLAIFRDNMKERMSNAVVEPFPVNPVYMQKITEKGGALTFERLSEALLNADLSPYRNEGFPLTYPRKDFINDFSQVISGLSEEDRKYVFKLFKFSVDDKKSIIKYPQQPDNKTKSEVRGDLRECVDKCSTLVDKFMLHNKVVLKRGDEKLEGVLNEITQAFPEFISVIGKKQHRAGTVDFHTFEDIKLCLRNPELKELTEAEQRNLFLAALFHDFSKEEGTVDGNHPYSSAKYAKEIMKKVPVSNDDKERIYYLIKHSHWTTYETTDDDLAVYFRRPNDFKAAYIFAEADTTSAGFHMACTRERREYIQNKIDLINQNAIPLFVNNIPLNPANLEELPDGTKYMDFTEPEADIGKYGFKAGTKVKDLRLLAYSLPQNNPREQLKVCWDDKEICLSACLSDYKNQFSAGYNDGIKVILGGYNSNIALAGHCAGKTEVGKDFTHFKKYLELNCDYPGRRTEIPEKIREMLGIDKEEYVALYNAIGNLTDPDEIPDVSVSTGKIISAERIKDTIKKISDYALNPVLCSCASSSAPYESSRYKGAGLEFRDKERERNFPGHLNHESDDVKVAYQNETVIFNPKIEAVVINKYKLFSTEASDKREAEILKDFSKETKIPIIAV